MKFRSSFVTNSSSSSYICCMCGAQEEAYDDMPYGWKDLCDDDYGHHICNSCIKDTDGEHCPICNLEAFAVDDLAKYLLKKYGIPRETIFEEIKKVNRRRKKLHDFEYNQKVCERLEKNEDVLLEEIKKEYSNYETFHKFICGY